MIFRTPFSTMTLSRPLAPLVLALSMSWLLAGCNGQKAESAAAPPAAEVGLKAGDILLEIDGKDLTGNTDVSKILRGQVGILYLPVS